MAEDAKNGAQGANVNENGGADNNEQKTYTTEEINKMMEDARAEEREKAKKEAKVNFEKAKKESERLAKMNEQERYEYELSQREAAIEAKEKELSLAENKAAASQILLEKGLDISLVDFVVAEDADVMSNNIKLLDKAFKASVKQEVEKRLAGSTPKKNLPPDGTMDKKQFSKLSLAEMTELKHNNPELYAEMTGK